MVLQSAVPISLGRASEHDVIYDQVRTGLLVVGVDHEFCRSGTPYRRILIVADISVFESIQIIHVSVQQDDVAVLRGSIRGPVAQPTPLPPLATIPIRPPDPARFRPLCSQFYWSRLGVSREVCTGIYDRAVAIHFPSSENGQTTGRFPPRIWIFVDLVPILERPTIGSDDIRDLSDDGSFPELGVVFGDRYPLITYGDR